MTERELIVRLADSLQEARRVAALAYEADQSQWRGEGVDPLGALERARDILEVAEDYRERGPECLAEWEAR